MNGSQGGVYLGLGTNLGDRVKNINDALEGLERLRGVRLLRRSILYRSKPWGVEDQPDFLNAACEIDSEREPGALLDALQNLEKRLGRRKGRRWGPRVIDLDILLWQNLVLKSERLSIPHPRLTERAFALKPLLELAPGLIHPETGRPLAEYLGEALEKEPEASCEIFDLEA